MGKDNRVWRKLVKKLRRKRIRQKLAADRDLNEPDSEHTLDSKQSEYQDGQELQKLKEEEEKLTHELEEQKWIEREIQTQLEYQMEKAKQDKFAATKAEEAKKIREEWEKRQQEEKQMREEKERIQKELKEKQDEEFDKFLSFLSGDIETPPLPYVMPEEIDNGKEKCSFFDRTGVCLFAEQCSRNHFRPTLSKTILIPNFFSHFSLEQSLRDEFDTDMCLEYEDTEMYKEFLEFYNDVLPELRKIGKVIQFKVCCNYGMHLRGNVYVQYETIRESVNAYREFNARFFNGKQLSLQFAKIDSWKSAICGLFLRKRCLKGKTCNFLHVFRNPTKEFVSADHDWKETVNKTSSNRASRKDTERDHKELSGHAPHSRSRSRNDRHKKDKKSHNHRSRSRSPRSRRYVSRSREHDRHRSRNEGLHCQKRKSKSPSKPGRSTKEKKKSKKRSKDYDRNSCGNDMDGKIEKSIKTPNPEVEIVLNNSQPDIQTKSPVKEKHKKSKKSKKSKKHKKEKKKHKSSSGTIAIN